MSSMFMLSLIHLVGFIICYFFRYYFGRTSRFQCFLSRNALIQSEPLTWSYQLMVHSRCNQNLLSRNTSINCAKSTTLLFVTQYMRISSLADNAKSVYKWNGLIGRVSKNTEGFQIPLIVTSPELTKSTIAIFYSPPMVTWPSVPTLYSLRFA